MLNTVVKFSFRNFNIFSNLVFRNFNIFSYRNLVIGTCKIVEYTCKMLNTIGTIDFLSYNMNTIVAFTYVYAKCFIFVRSLLPRDCCFYLSADDDHHDA